MHATILVWLAAQSRPDINVDRNQLPLLYELGLDTQLNRTCVSIPRSFLRLQGPIHNVVRICTYSGLVTLIWRGCFYSVAYCSLGQILLDIFCWCFRSFAVQFTKSALGIPGLHFFPGTFFCSSVALLKEEIWIIFPVLIWRHQQLANRFTWKQHGLETTGFGCIFA